MPAGNAKGRVAELTELALIRHETQKQQRHCRIRDLIERAGAAVQALKPCFMMSPLSVSRFIAENNAYKDFLSYATSGTIDEGGTITGKEPDSPFEIAVCRRIEAMGLEAVPQVGVAGFFVDIGVRRRDGDRSFILGVECDGATYHSAKSARDRDRLREEVIRARGWPILTRSMRCWTPA